VPIPEFHHGKRPPKVCGAPPTGRTVLASHAILASCTFVVDDEQAEVGVGQASKGWEHVGYGHGAAEVGRVLEEKRPPEATGNAEERQMSKTMRPGGRHKHAHAARKHATARRVSASQKSRQRGSEDVADEAISHTQPPCHSSPATQRA